MSLRFFPLILLVISVLVYGMFIPFLGYYDDEWTAVYNLAAIGHSAMVEYQQSDRPFWGLIWGCFSIVLGSNPLAWHLFALLTKWLSATAFWLMLRAIWPRKLQAAAAIALVFLLYPGIQQESRALFFGFWWLQLALVFFSYSVMIRSIRQHKNRWLFTAIGLICVAPTWLITEYFVGLEILRPFVLWMVLPPQVSQNFRRLFSVIRSWLPYFLLLCAYMLWRFMFFETTREEVNPSYFFSVFLSDPIPELLSRIDFVIPDIVESTFLAWTQILASDLFRIASLSSWLAWFVGALVGVIVYFSLIYMPSYRNIENTSKTSCNYHFARTLVAAGLAAILAGMLPMWFAGLDIRLSGMETRFAFPAITGACLLLYGLLKLLVGSWKQMATFLSILIWLATGAHIKAANDYRHEWINQKQLFWQLAWRIPDLTPNTLVWIHQEGWQTKLWTSPYSDIHYAAPINLMYRQNDNPEQLNYWATLLDQGNRKSVSKFNINTSYHKQVRNLRFSRSPNHNLIISFTPPSCLKILRQDTQQLNLPIFLRGAEVFSNTNLVIRSPDYSAAPPVEIFGSEPEHLWCYYYQKADLAYQFKDWKIITELGDKAQANDLSPRNPDEWNIFVEAYQQLGRHDEASRLLLPYQP